MLKEMVILEELLPLSITIQVEEPHLLKYPSEIHIDIKKTNYISLLLKELILDNLFIVETKLKLL